MYDNLGRDWPLHGFTRITSYAELCRFTDANPDALWRISYGGPNDPKQFDRVAARAMKLGVLKPVLFIAEELADLTQPGKATGGWGELTRAGRGIGNDAMAITQRIQEIDKTTATQASLVRIYQQNTPRDAEYIERNTGIPAADVEKLKPHEFIEKDMINKEIRTGTN